MPIASMGFLQKKLVQPIVIWGTIVTNLYSQAVEGKPTLRTRNDLLKSNIFSVYLLPLRIVRNKGLKSNKTPSECIPHSSGVLLNPSTTQGFRETNSGLLVSSNIITGNTFLGYWPMLRNT